MWYVYYYDFVFSKKYVRVPYLDGFTSNASAQFRASFCRLVSYLSYIVLPY